MAPLWLWAVPRADTRAMRARLVLLMALAGCGGVEVSPEEPAPGAEARSIDGKPLVAPPLADDVRVARERDLAVALAESRARPTDPDALIWVGRRLGYLGRFRDAIASFTDGTTRFPTDARFLRHRGHRWITLRRFDRAIADLETAAKLMLATPDAVEPDGQPNARNVPTGTLYFNVYYHLALAHYLAGDFARSAAVWELCQGVSQNPDKAVATSYWHVLTLRRLGDETRARAVLATAARDLEVIENHAYHALLRAFAVDDLSRAVAGDGANDRATIGNGVATWLFLSGATEPARAAWSTVVGETPWPAFGHIAAEVELARTSGVRR